MMKTDFVTCVLHSKKDNENGSGGDVHDDGEYDFVEI